MTRLRKSVTATGWSVVVATLIASVGPAQAQQSSKCKLVQAAELPVHMEQGQPIVEALVNGKPARFMLDTGAFASSLFVNSAQRLGLHLVRTYAVSTYGVGGGADTFITHVADLTLDKLHDKGGDMMVLGASSAVQSSIDGIIGEDVLSRSDLEFDLADGKIRMIIPENCSGDDVVYWGKAYSVTPMLPVSSGDKVLVAIKLNGVRVNAEIDSGSGATVATLGAASRAGVRPEGQGVASVDASNGLGQRAVQTYRAVFPTFTFGDETIKNANIRLADLFRDDKQTNLGSRIPTSVSYDFPDMLLGADFLISHRFYIARKQRAVYVSYVGGPVFQDPTAPTPKATTNAAN